VPPAFGRLGARLEHVAPCTTAVRLPLAPELLLPDGRPSGAVTALLADFALTTSVIASLPDLRGVTTVALTVEHLALPPTTGSLVSRCTSTAYGDGRPQHAAGALHDDTGRPLAAVSGWFLAAPAEAASAQRIGLPSEPAAAHLRDLPRRPGRTALRAVGTARPEQRAGDPARRHRRARRAARRRAALGSDLRPLTSTFAFLRPTPRDGTSPSRAPSCARAGAPAPPRRP
jgi:acyl-coenzyme A thioesterase PaaI-like protein